MSFSHIKSVEFSNLSNDIVKLSNIIKNEISFDSNKEYKINIIKHKKINYIETYRLNVEQHKTLHQDSKYPENGLIIELNSGIYKLLYKDGSITNKTENTFINSSEGKVIFDEYDLKDNKLILNKINQFKFKISKNELFSIWVETDNLENISGEIEFDLIKILSTKINTHDNIFNSFLFDINTLNQITLSLDKNFDYIFEIYELDAKHFENVIYKYPEGTYKITLNEKINTGPNDEFLKGFINKDKSKFNLVNEKISSLYNITIPENVNPINYYIMLGKIEYLVYINFLTDTFYFQPYSFAECFMSLYVPESTCEIIETNESYYIYKVTTYQLIEKSYKNKNQIYQNFSRWLNIPIKNINIDEYELFYWAIFENDRIDYFYNDLKKYMEIESLFVYIKFEINANIYDNVSKGFENHINKNFDNDQTGIGFKYIDCTFTLVNKSNDINWINWNEPGDWQNVNNNENILYAPIYGEGIFKISKQRFKRITGFDIDEVNSSNITPNMCNEFNFNLPDIKPYNRFQYWLRTTKF